MAKKKLKCNTGNYQCGNVCQGDDRACKANIESTKSLDDFAKLVKERQKDELGGQKNVNKTTIKKWMAEKEGQDLLDHLDRHIRYWQNELGLEKSADQLADGLVPDNEPDKAKATAKEFTTSDETIKNKLIEGTSLTQDEYANIFGDLLDDEDADEDSFNEYTDTSDNAGEDLFGSGPDLSGKATKLDKEQASKYDIPLDESGALDLEKFEERANQLVERLPGIESMNDAAEFASAFYEEEIEPPPSLENGIALKAYSSGAYAAVNEALRNGETNDVQNEFTQLVNDAIEELPKFEGEVVRGFSVHDPKTAKQLLESYKEGETITEAGFLSTSRNIDIAESFGGTASYSESTAEVLYRIKATGKNGAYIDRHSLHEGEEEVLFKSGTSFKIDKVEFDTDDESSFGRHVITLTEQ